jgi:hypothetical protein
LDFPTAEISTAASRVENEAENYGFIFLCLAPARRKWYDIRTTE